MDWLITKCFTAAKEKTKQNLVLSKEDTQVWNWEQLVLLGRVWLSVTPWTVAHQAPLSMGFSRQEYWGGFPYSPPGDLPDPGIELGPSALQADSLPSEPPLLTEDAWS